ncbi:putative nacht and tpr domain protein [Neofusicoccum parvum UCRNP2]|uniref:Putative nacht and tpr domain protein n=1 Tax=Botryosphaeria parva (strain UCR-NP2) TaxID=1287680 RepID=R1EBR9_BOTPV|nr:putative nacht and tpr domain protein [Neofusicoccum parvum UCRNP2]
MRRFFCCGPKDVAESDLPAKPAKQVSERVDRSGVTATAKARKEEQSVESKAARASGEASERNLPTEKPAIPTSEEEATKDGLPAEKPAAASTTEAEGITAEKLPAETPATTREEPAEEQSPVDAPAVPTTAETGREELIAESPAAPTTEDVAEKELPAEVPAEVPAEAPAAAVREDAGADGSPAEHPAPPTTADSSASKYVLAPETAEESSVVDAPVAPASEDSPADVSVVSTKDDSPAETLVVSTNATAEEEQPPAIPEKAEARNRLSIISTTDDAPAETFATPIEESSPVKLPPVPADEEPVVDVPVVSAKEDVPAEEPVVSTKENVSSETPAPSTHTPEADSPAEAPAAPATGEASIAQEDSVATIEDKKDPEVTTEETVSAETQDAPVEEIEPVEEFVVQSRPMDDVAPVEDFVVQSRPMEETSPADEFVVQSRPMEEITASDEFVVQSRPMEEITASDESIVQSREVVPVEPPVVLTKDEDSHSEAPSTSATDSEDDSSSQTTAPAELPKAREDSVIPKGQEEKFKNIAVPRLFPNSRQGDILQRAVEAYIVNGRSDWTFIRKCLPKSVKGDDSAAQLTKVVLTRMLENCLSEVELTESRVFLPILREQLAQFYWEDHKDKAAIKLWNKVLGDSANGDSDSIVYRARTNATRQLCNIYFTKALEAHISGEDPSKHAKKLEEAAGRGADPVTTMWWYAHCSSLMLTAWHQIHDEDADRALENFRFNAKCAVGKLEGRNPSHAESGFLLLAETLMTAADNWESHVEGDENATRAMSLFLQHHYGLGSDNDGEHCSNKPQTYGACETCDTQLSWGHFQTCRYCKVDFCDSCHQSLEETTLKVRICSPIHDFFRTSGPAPHEIPKDHVLLDGEQVHYKRWISMLKEDWGL